MDKKAARKALWEHCREFIDVQGIGCPETIYQTDRVAEASYEFIHGICEIVGYHEHEDE